MMDIKITTGAETVITVSGRLDTSSSADFETAIEPVLAGDLSKVMVECSNLDYISSSGLRLFLMLQKKTAQKKGSLRLCGLKPEIKEVFSITGFAAIFRIEE